MKRDPRLQPLSREHHHALVLARRAMRGGLTPGEARSTFYEMLALHFATEEKDLVPVLRAAGRSDLADRMLYEHEKIRTALAREHIATFGRLLAEHVRFEERELFPAYEALLDAA